MPKLNGAAGSDRDGRGRVRRAHWEVLPEESSLSEMAGAVSVERGARCYSRKRACPALDHAQKSKPALHFIGLHAQDRTSEDVRILLPRVGASLSHGRTQLGRPGMLQSVVPCHNLR